MFEIIYYISSPIHNTVKLATLLRLLCLRWLTETAYQVELGLTPGGLLLWKVNQTIIVVVACVACRIIESLRKSRSSGLECSKVIVRFRRSLVELRGSKRWLLLRHHKVLLLLTILRLRKTVLLLLRLVEIVLLLLRLSKLLLLRLEKLGLESSLSLLRLGLLGRLRKHIN